MHIDDILAGIARGERPLIPESWGQGRTTFGGLTGAILCQALMTGMDSDRILRALDISFTRPFEALKAYDLEVEEFANGKTVCIRQVRLLQDGKIRAVAKADFVKMLASSVCVDTFVAPKLIGAEQAEHLTHVNPPLFFGQFDNRVATGAMPFSGASQPSLGGWTRFAHTPQQLTAAHLVCLIDSWPPTASPLYDSPKPLSTVSWNIHFNHPVNEVAPESFLGYLAHVNFSEGSISSSCADIWTPAGRLLARSVQTSLIYG